MARKFTCILLLLLLSPIGKLHAQTTARAEIISYNETSASMILSMSESDVRYHQISTEGSIVSITIDGITSEAYLIPSDLDTGDHYQTVRLLGYAPSREENPLALVVARSASAIQHFDRTTNPMRTFDANVGDEARVTQITPPPMQIQREIDVPVFAISGDGSLYLDMSQFEAEQSGLLPGITGTVSAGSAAGISFEMVRQDIYITILNPTANLYAYFTDLPGDNRGTFVVITSPPNQGVNVAAQYGVAEGDSLHFTYSGFDYGETSAGQVLALENGGQRIFTSISSDYLERIQVQPGAYVLVSINGVIRAAMVMDDALYAASLQRFGRSSNYIIFFPAEGQIIVEYTRQDGRTAAEIFSADIGDRVRLRPANAIETVARDDVIVKAAVEIAPGGFVYTDITPYELSFLEVLPGQYVTLRINDIEYRSKVIDDNLLGSVEPGEMLVYLAGDFLIISHAVGDNITAEERFQVSVGDPVIIERAPN